MKRIQTIILLLFGFCLVTPAQDTSEQLQANPVVQAFKDSLNQLKASYYAHYRIWEDLDIPVPRSARLNVNFYKLHLPPTYYSAPIRQAFEVDWTPDKKMGMTLADSIRQAVSGSSSEWNVPQLTSSADADRWVNKILRNYYIQYPDYVKGNEMSLAGVKAFDDSQALDTSNKKEIKSYMKTENPVAENVEADNELVVVKPNFWKKTGNGSLQFSQHGISDNWYQGGESTNALLAELKLTANYDDRQRVQFENSLEIKVGFITAPSDTVHKYKTNADLFRLNSKLGVRAVKNLYYTLAAEFKTQFFPNYKTNTNDMISNFLSPAQLDVSLGLDYKLEKSKYKLSVMGSPLSYTFVYIDNDKIINPSSFNVEEGKSTAHLFGSKLTANFDWNIISNISYSSKLDYFTTYNKVIANWENTFNFQVSRYLSAKIFLHARFDDGVKLDEDNDSYFQFKEMLTFGLSYSW